MSVTAWRSAGTAVSLAYDGGSAWSNPENVGAADAVTAAATEGGVATSQHLRASGFGFSTADLPASATIEGVEVEIVRREANAAGAVSDNVVRLASGGAGSGADLIGNNLAAAGNWPATLATAAYGGATDAWGATLTGALVHAATFGVNIRAYLGNRATAAVDHIRMRLHYTAVRPHSFAAIIG